jgi:hypothetical protein
VTDGASAPADVMPAVAAAVGVRLGSDGGAGLVLPAARHAVVVLVDGLGDLLLRQRGGHAPFLRQLRSAAGAGVLTSGYPSTTATSMAMIGTGAQAGMHGLVGLDVLDPDRDVLFSELAWDPAVDPRRWQPLPTVFEHLVTAGRDLRRLRAHRGRVARRPVRRRRDPRRPGRRHGRRGQGGAADRSRLRGLPLLGRARQDRSRARLRLVPMG